VLGLGVCTAVGLGGLWAGVERYTKLDISGISNHSYWRFLLFVGESC
jgi:hypothetical protein